jgi:hypothetical protein
LERNPSGAKAHNSFCAIYGTTKVVPLQGGLKLTATGFFGEPEKIAAKKAIEKVRGKRMVTAPRIIFLRVIWRRL